MLVSYAEFEEWLTNLPWGTLVGYPGEPCDCPVARFLMRKFYAEFVSVCAFETRVEHVITQIEPTDLWVEQFISKVDNTYSDGAEITREEALECLS